MLLQHIAMEKFSSPPLQNPNTQPSSSSLNLTKTTSFLNLKHLQIKSQHNKNNTLILFLFLLLFFSLNKTTNSQESHHQQIPYSDYCNDIVLETPLAQQETPFNATSFFLTLRGAWLHAPPGSSLKSKPTTLNLYTKNVYLTQNVKRFKLEGGLRFSRRIGPEYFGDFGHKGRNLRLVYHRPPRFPTGLSRDFKVSGFWDLGSGKVCLVGSGLENSKTGRVDVLVKLDYLNSSDILHSVVNGTLERIDVNDKNVYSKPFGIVGLNLRNYVYSLVDKEAKSGGFREFGDWSNVSMGVGRDGSVCSVISRAGTMEMVYSGECGDGKCDFLGSGFRPRFLWFSVIECGGDGRGRFLLNFDDVERSLKYFVNQTLVAEGKWDEKTKTVDMVGCRIFNGSVASEKGFVGDCVVRLSLRFPSRWTLRERSVVVGEIWKRNGSNESRNYGTVALRSPRNLVNRLEGLRYEYTASDNVTSSCAKAMSIKGTGGKYPNVHSSDMRFDMTLRNRRKAGVFGYSSPLSAGDKFYRSAPDPVQVNNNQSTMSNISYVMHFVAPRQFLRSDEHNPLTIEISAEGLYNSKNGHLCMVGCMYFSSHQPYKSLSDCEIVINIHFPPLKGNARSGVIGTIESMRKTEDPLYFEPLELISNSIYAGQARDSMWRMDLEMTMVLISNTLACIFVGLQLFYVKKNPNVLPFISVVMLAVLTLAHMIPLLLNFEALFVAGRRRRNVYFGGDGWVEVNEVLIRVMTMIAFLLEFRLLQLTWSARGGDESPKTPSISDKKVLYLALPVYLCGGLIAYFIHLSRNPHPMYPQSFRRYHYQQQTMWGGLKSYAGLILDGFLLPQVLFNLFCNTTERALTPGFYVGTTLVRLMPHIYDLYRAHSNAWSFDYIYGNPKMDYYSTAWDIIICCGGLLLVVLISLQQRFGGRCFLPKRYRDSSAYEKVPVVSTESITEE